MVSASQSLKLPATARVVRAVLRSGVRGRTRLTRFLAGRLKSLQSVPIPLSGEQVLYADLRLASSHGLLVGGRERSGEEEVMRRVVRRGDTVYDVGAHIGLHTVLLSELAGPSGRVCAFEPNADVLPALRLTVGRLPNVVLHAFGLSDETKDALLIVPEDPSMASLVDWTEGQHGATHAVPCALRRMDDLVREGLARPPDFVKCDVEGAELRVFLGGRETLNRPEAPVILFEANVNSARGFGLGTANALEFLRDLPRPHYQFFKVSEGGATAPISTVDDPHANVLAVPRERLHLAAEAPREGVTAGRSRV